MRFIPHHEVKQRLVYDGVRVVVVDKLCMGGLIGPGTWVGPTEDLKVCFNLLVNMFCLAIRLEVVGSREGEVIIEEFAKFFGKSRGELWTTIRDDFAIKSEA